MSQTARTAERSAGHRMTVSQLRHDIRNHLNAIKLCSALLHRRHVDPASRDSIREIDQAVNGINELITRCLGDADAPSLLRQEED